MHRSTIRRPVLACLGAALLATAVIASLGVLAQRHAALDEAISGARAVTSVIARDVVAPALTDQALVAGTPQQRALNALVHDHVLSSSVVRVKVWSGDGTILYSDRTAVEGRQFTLGASEQRALRTGSATAELSNLTAPENTGERSFGRLLEVYLGVRTSSGRPVLFETYQRYDAVVGDGRRTLRRFLPALLGGLGLLFVLQVPLVVSLARRVQSGQRRQSDLLQRALDASDRERRRIASDLHDGVVQGLAGASYTLSATAERLALTGTSSDGEGVREVAGALRQWVRELRTLVLDITPPRLHTEGLQPALDDLLSTLATRGTEVSLDADLRVHPSKEAEALVFRVAQEAVRNVTRHAQARRTDVSVASNETGVVLQVVDDGVGFSPEDRRQRRTEGHVGLDLLTELAVASGGTLAVHSEPGAGTTVRLELP